MGQFSREVGRVAEKEGLPSGKIFTVENAGSGWILPEEFSVKGTQFF